MDGTKAFLLEKEEAQRGLKNKGMKDSVISKNQHWSDMLTTEPEIILVNLSQGLYKLRYYFYYHPNYPLH